jgi:hypothetical protein
MDDLEKFVHSSSTEYLIGAVILCDTNDSGVKHIIDGQQRTVTLTLFLMCAFKFITRELKDSVDPHLWVQIESCFNRGTRFDQRPSVVFSQKRADSIMEEIRGWLVVNGDDADKRLKDLDTYSTTQKNLLAVVRYFTDGLIAETWFSRIELKFALQKILDNVRVLQLNLSNQREAIQVYDRINNRGRHLSGGDLVKNQIFQQVSDEQFEIINENWTTVVETLRQMGSAKTQEPTFLLRSLSWGYRQGKTTYDDLPDFFIKYFEKGGPDETPINPAAFSNELVEAAEAIGSFTKMKHRKHGDLPLLMVPQWLGTVQHYAILLAGEKIKTKEAFLELYQQISTRTMLYLFAKEPTPTFETLVNNWAHRVFLAGPDATVAQIKEIFEEHVGYPIDMVQQMKANSSKWSSSKSSEKKRIRASLALMSWWLDIKAKEANGDISEYFRTRKKKGERAGWDVDHVEPQRCTELGLTDEEKNRFGNLVLLHPSDNRGARNATASTKKSEYQHSKITLTMSLVQGEYPNRVKSSIELVRELGDPNEIAFVDDWSAKAIDLRTSLYVNFLEAIITRTI